jgi:hypothetical protein
MTILTALKAADDIFYGYNDGQTVGDSPMPGQGCPWIVFGRWALGVSGSSGIFNVIRHHAADLVIDKASAADIIFKLRRILIEYGFGHRDDGEPEDRYGIWCILVNIDGEIWDVDDKLAYSSIPEGILWARGSGMDYALGADFVSSKQGLAPEVRIRVATDAAIALDLFCGGASHVRVLNQASAD